MTINLLSEEIRNQIAAGEVIENPSAVIKELIENSIDAKADLIEVEIENAGFKKIVVKDNGEGISKEDLILAPKRHATSKIKKFDDLYNINSMGFRGEALASIFSVAKTKLISKKKNDKAYEINYNNLNEIKESSCSNGTLIVVEDLFYNTPVRKKYLKSENLELKNIIDVYNRFIMSYKSIKFVLKHNGKIIINKPSFKEEIDNLYYIFGKEIRDNLLEVNFEEKGIKIKGFIGNPSSLSYSHRKNQFLFVNNRFVKSKLIRDAIYEGFSTNLMEGRHPFFVLFIEIDPEIIDVNIHPSKIEVKFENELEIFLIVKKAITKIFTENVIFKKFVNEKVNKEKDFGLEVHLEKTDRNYFEKKKENVKKNIKKIDFDNKENKYFSKETQKSLVLKELEDEILRENKEIDDRVTEEFNELIEKKEDYGPLYDKLKDYRIVGQINKTFIIIETPDEMIIIDQHVAEEKFYFENFKKELENKKISSQKLLNSEIVELNNSEMLLFKENKELIDKLGFDCEIFGENEIIVRGVPIGIKGEILNPNLLKEILNEINVDKKFKSLEEKKIEKLASMACKKSIKAGHEMTTPEIHRMIENLKKLKEPFNCPHGRPILLNWSFKDLEKKFKRIV